MRELFIRTLIAVNKIAASITFSVESIGCIISFGIEFDCGIDTGVNIRFDVGFDLEFDTGFNVEL